MSQAEAWTVTALGLAVVFVGLVACIGLIALLGRIAPRVQWDRTDHATATTPATVTPATAPPVPADVLAVICVVLEIERTLYMNRPGARVTIRRHTASP